MTFGTATGYRLKIEGLGVEPVTDSNMETAVGGTTRIEGLLRRGLRIQDASDMGTCEIDSSPMTFSVIDRQSDDVFTTWFSQQPAVKCWLTADMSTAATSISVTSTTGISTNDYIHIGTETMKVTAVPTSTTLTVNRGQWGTVIQAHYTGDGERLVSPVVTLTRPMSLEGRRVNLYRYTEDDDPQGDGTQIWRGVLTSDASLSEDGLTWTMRADSLATLLKQDLGSDLETPIYPRGIYYPETAPFVIVVSESTSTSWPSGLGDYVDPLQIVLSGFWETQEDFCADLTTALQNWAGSGFTGTNIVASPDDARGTWKITYTADATTPRWVLVRPRYGADYLEGAVIPSEDITSTDIVASQQVTMYAGTRGTAHMLTGAAMVPRGAFGGREVIDLPEAWGAPANRFYHAEPIDLSVGDFFDAKWSETDAQSFPQQIEAVDATNRYVDLNYRPMDPATPPVYWTPNFLPRITLRRQYVTGDDFGAFLTYLTSNAASNCNKGSMPRVTTDDLDPSEDVVDDAHRGIHYLSARTYAGAQSIELGELVMHECRALGVFPAITSAGKIALQKMWLPTSTEPADFTLSPQYGQLTDEQGIKWERNAYGSFNTVTIKTGYDYVDDDHKGREYRARDVYAMSTRPSGQDLEIAPKSAEAWGDSIDVNLARAIGGRVTGVYGRPYSTVQVEVPEVTAEGVSLIEVAVVGSVAAITTHRVPSTIAGGRGITSARGRVLARDWDLERARGVLTIMLRDEAAAGYAPNLTITGSALVSGNTYDLTVTYMDPYNVASTAAEGTLISDHFAADMVIDVLDWDTTTSTPQQATVVSVTDSTSPTGTLRVTFGSAPTLTGTRYVRFADDGVSVASQEAYAYLADDAAELTFASGTRQAHVFAE